MEQWQWTSHSEQSWYEKTATLKRSRDSSDDKSSQDQNGLGPLKWRFSMLSTAKPRWSHDSVEIPHIKLCQTKKYSPRVILKQKRSTKVFNILNFFTFQKPSEEESTMQLRKDQSSAKPWCQVRSHMTNTSRLPTVQLGWAEANKGCRPPDQHCYFALYW